MTTHASLLRALMPPGSYDPNGRFLAAQLLAEGAALDAALQSAGAVRGAITPYYAGEMLPDWERVLGITPSGDATAQQRIDACIAKISQTGGLSIPYFTQLAAALGYDVQIIEPQYPQAGIARCGDTMWDADVIWTWCVAVTGAPVLSYLARAGTAVSGDRILAFADPVLETVFDDLKPAFTYCYFEYTGAS